MKTLGIAILAIGLLAGGTAATAGERQPVAVQIDTAGVDFADPAAVAELRRELARKIDVACTPGNELGAPLMPDFRCRREMTESLEPAVNQLVARASDRQMASSS